MELFKKIYKMIFLKLLSKFIKFLKLILLKTVKYKKKT
jgi:hypothetical protein